MKISQFVTNITINDSNNPGQIISLNVHQIDGGYIGIDTNFTEEVANYIINPYEECELVKLVDSDGNDEEFDPPLSDDTIIGFLRILKAIDYVVQRHENLNRFNFRILVANAAKMSVDEYDVYLGLAQAFLTESKVATSLNSQ